MKGQQKHSLTSQKIQALQDKIFRKMSAEKRLHIAGEMFDFAKKLIASEGDTIYDRIRKASYKNRGRT